MSDVQTNLEQLLRFTPADKRANLGKIQTLLGVSQGVAVSLSLCQEVMRDYCEPEEHGAVVAALFGIVSRQKEQSNV
jgi:hypothetical protein